MRIPSAEEQVRFCIKAAEEAYAAVLENPPEAVLGTVGAWMRSEAGRSGEVQPVELMAGEELAKVAQGAAMIAFRACMPHVTGRRQTQAYIACVAAGVQLRYITGMEARSLLYTAQLALAASRSSRTR